MEVLDPDIIKDKWKTERGEIGSKIHCIIC